MPEGMKDTNTYHVFCNNMLEVAAEVESFALNFGALVSMTITPFKE